jgi:hypothetical protein
MVPPWVFCGPIMAVIQHLSGLFDNKDVGNIPFRAQGRFGFDSKALRAYIKGMKSRHAIQYTIRNVPARLNQVLREKAVTEQKSLNEATLDALEKGAGLADEEVRHHDMDDLAGTWVEDPEFDRAIRDMDKVDPELWK